MAVALLKNLGVDQVIIQALVKSYGKDLQGLEIAKDDNDLKLVVKNAGGPERNTHILTISRFFSESTGRVVEPEPLYGYKSYKCRDRIEFLESDGSDAENVRINGTGLKLSDALYNLLHHLAEVAIESENGWVYIQDLKEQGIIPSDGYQPFSRLRSILAGYLLEKNPHDVIESNGRKQYRLAIDPANILIPEGARK